VRVAFIIFSHRGPDQLCRLLSTLRQQLPDSPLIVHHDKFRTKLVAGDLAQFENTHLLTSDHPIVWGDFSLVEATWRILRGMGANVEFDWVVVLSAQDYPIKPLAELPRFLTSAEADALISARPMSALPTASLRRNIRLRFLYQYRPAKVCWPARSSFRPAWIRLRQSTALVVDVFNNCQRSFKIHKSPDGLPWRFGRRASWTPFSADRPCWFGSVWFGLSRQAVAHLLTFVQNNPDYVAYYERTACPDESVTATIVCNAPDLRVKELALHHVRWSRPRSGHPDVLGIDDLPELLASPAFFARKFDLAGDSAILDQLDQLNSGVPSS
jgi:hypothetical protein